MNTQIKIYNNLSIRQILNKLPLGMAKMHKMLYINNCIFIYKNEPNGYNLGYCELIRNANFNLINLYL